MSVSRFLLLTFFIRACPVLFVTSNGIPSEEALQAKSPEEFLAAEQKVREKRAPKRIRETLLRSSKSPLGIASIEKSEYILANHFDDEPGFYHGVASGDPLPDAVVLWTRYTPENEDDTLLLELRIAEVDPSVTDQNLFDMESNDHLRVAQIEVTKESDFVAKVDVTGLKSNTHYVFAFSDGNKVSEIGQTRTAPAHDENVEAMTYAFFSCAHFSNGYFHPYDVASTIKDLDFWVHVGDYIYEYGDYESYASDAPERKAKTLPKWEIVDLQDYRNRYATYHLDEGLRNLRRRAPVIQIWDDHELTNNAYGEGDVLNTGAENHQEICSANRESSDEEKAAAQCDRDEGNVKIRFNDAARAYMEWMPLRRGPGNMGVIDITSITQVIEWGELASIVAIDTRVTSRSMEPTLASVFGDFAGFAFGNTNITAYYDPNSEVRQTFEVIASGTKERMNDPSFTMIGEENSQLIMDVFSESKLAGKTWQIFAGGTMMGPQKAVNMHSLADYAPPGSAPFVKAYTDAILADPGGFLFRAAVAMDLTDTPYNRDGFDGFAYERANLLNGFAQHTNNPIVLGGDLHDSWAWTLYEGGKMSGKPVAVNLGCPGVTSPGWGPFLGGLLTPLMEPLGGLDNVYKLVADNFVGINTGLVFADIQRKGFVAVKATKNEHIAEYILFDSATTLANYDDARRTSGKLTADFSCAISLKTTAGQPGSLVPQPHCSAIEFDPVRPSVWGLSVPGHSEQDPTSLKDCGYNACVFDASFKHGKSSKSAKSGKGTKDKEPKGKASKGAKSPKKNRSL